MDMTSADSTTTGSTPDASEHAAAEAFAAELDAAVQADDSAPMSDAERADIVASIRANRLRDADPADLEAAEAVADDLGARFGTARH